MSFNNIAMQGKIIVLLGALGLISLGAVLFSGTRMAAIDAQYRRIIDGPDKASIYLARANRQMAWSERAIYKTMAAVSDDDLATAKDNLFQARKKFPEYANLAKAAVPAEAARIDTLSATFNAALDESCATTLDLARAQNKAGAFAAMKSTCGPALNTAIEQAKGLLETTIADSEKAAKDAHASSQSTSMATIAIVLGGLFCVIAGAFVLTQRGITRPINAINHAMDEMAQQRYDTGVPGGERRDELGAMARTLEILRQSLSDAERIRHSVRESDRQSAARMETERAVVSDFRERIGHLADAFVQSSADVLRAAEGLSITADDTRHQAQLVTGAAEDAAANVQTVAAATEEMSASVREINGQVSRAAQVAQEAAGEASRTESEIRALSEAAQGIGEVVNLINDIASQTNLLALNATIEAARAGEAGKGFAVVASEVKQLATQTARATQDIGDKVNQIQTATQRTVGSIEKIVATIADIRSISASVAAAVEQQGAATSEIAGNTARASSGTQAVTENIFGVGRAAEMTGAASTLLMTLSGDLTRQAESLQSEVKVFVEQLSANA